jgi:hypothetical protein
MLLLSREFLLKHARAVILAEVTGQALSRFERQLIEKVGRRWLAFGNAATATASEQAAILGALDRMEYDLRWSFAGNRAVLLERLTNASRATETAE